MTIALDATEAAHPEPTGTGVYSQMLIKALADSRPASGFPDPRLALCLRIGPYCKWGRKRRWPPGCSASPFWEPWLPPRAAALFHGLNQRLPRLPYPVRVVTIHDLFPLTSAEYSSPSFQQRFTQVLREAVGRADRIIAVSDATRQQLLRHTDASDSRIRIIHHGVDPIPPATAAEQQAFRQSVLGLRPEEKFFLNVGAIQVRKNVANIVLALKRLPDYRLVLAGADGYGAEAVHSLIEREGVSGRVVRTGHASRQTLRLLYSAAAALVFPSLEEGFGMPILEAMSCGLPVVTSNCSAMPEVAGDAAVCVDPRSVSEIAAAMRRVAEDEPFAADLRRRGHARAKLFTWAKCAGQTWDVYREVLGE
ncbi:MAG: glycosyltransferase family 4 protein [Terriglobia bacterium]